MSVGGWIGDQWRQLPNASKSSFQFIVAERACRGRRSPRVSSIADEHHMALRAGTRQPGATWCVAQPAPHGCHPLVAFSVCQSCAPDGGFHDVLCQHLLERYKVRDGSMFVTVFISANRRRGQPLFPWGWPCLAAQRSISSIWTCSARGGTLNGRSHPDTRHRQGHGHEHLELPRCPGEMPMPCWY